MSAERLAVSYLDTALLSAAQRIVKISRRYGIPPEKFRFSADPKLHREVLEVMALLREALYDRIETLNTFEEDSKNGRFVAPILTAPDHGKTFRQRMADYVSHWGYEIEAVIAAAGLEGVKDTALILENIREYMDHPYEDPWIRDHQGEGEAVRLNAIPHYGRGRAIAAKVALTTLLTTVVAEGWMQNWSRLNKGKRGYYVYRGSSFPCEICDAQTGFFHDASDEEGKPPYHPHCACFTVYTNQP